jgi:hypothetical protein
MYPQRVHYDSYRELRSVNQIWVSISNVRKGIRTSNSALQPCQDLAAPYHASRPAARKHVFVPEHLDGHNAPPAIRQNTPVSGN